MRTIGRLKTIAVAAGILVTAAFSGPAQAVPTTALKLEMDASASISAADFTTQINAYVAALNAFYTDPTNFGIAAIGGAVFGADVIGFFPVTTIDDATDLAALTDAILALDPANGGNRGGVDTSSTAIGDAVLEGSNELQAFEAALGVDLKLLIDVTTDGQNNTGADPVTAAQQAITDGINSVNCLGLGPAADCSFVTTAGAGTDFGTVSFADLEVALGAKIQQEVNGVPEPASLAILGTALAGLGLIRRRRRTA